MIDIYIGNSSNMILDYLPLILSAFSIAVTLIIAWFTIKYQREFYQHQRDINKQNLELSKLNVSPYFRIEVSQDPFGSTTPQSWQINISLIFISNSPVILHDLCIERISDKKAFRASEIKTISKHCYLMDVPGNVYKDQDKLKIFSFTFDSDDKYHSQLQDIADNYILVFQYSNTINKLGVVDPYIKRDKTKYHIKSIPVNLEGLNQFLK